MHLACLVLVKPLNTPWNAACIPVGQMSQPRLPGAKLPAQGPGVVVPSSELWSHLLETRCFYQRCFTALQILGPCCFLPFLEISRCPLFRATSLLACKAVLWHLWVQRPQQSHVKTRMVKALGTSVYTSTIVSPVSQPSVIVRAE